MRFTPVTLYTAVRVAQSTEPAALDRAMKKARITEEKVISALGLAKPRTMVRCAQPSCVPQPRASAAQWQFDGEAVATASRSTIRVLGS